MKTSEFDYDLPPDLIAQTPIEPRDAARMLVLCRDTGEVRHDRFADFPTYLHPGDVLVLNRTRVLPARLWARKIPAGGRVELLLLSRTTDSTWEALVRGRRVPVGTELEVTGPSESEPGPRACVTGVSPSGGRLIRFEEPPETWLERYGRVPLPPYIHRHLEDPERYQTVYSDTPGSVAAPTAGLHFTPAMLDRLRATGVHVEYVTLHVGLDTFRPVTEEQVEDHTIHSEWCEVTPEVSARLTRAKEEGRRIVAVGTTVVRTLETSAAQAAAAGADDVLVPFAGRTSLFILPGFRFRAVDVLLTNFHLPRSPLLLLVSAFAGRERILAAYREAVCLRYRFFSFGDCMLIM
ncbi:MAG: tRNA preQ1(34) S-adenosylmethionine ribosyltransferase-isomerase QueA [Anaerolineae bacterium]|nr:tRNA preQ1(34) S-adenosylmethionine ribosyltransferase-isomerase QueA [Anaerolineae bacterium]